MTNNQLNYLGLVETKRNNATQNKEMGRHNLITEKLTRKANRELSRHNLVTEANQQAETAAGIKRAGIAAGASRYSADASASASRYAADSAAAASRYAADTNAETNKYVADRNAQTNLTVAQINKQVQAAHDAVNKAINDSKISAQQKQSLAKNASDQFIKQMDRALEQYKIDKEIQAQYDKLKLDAAKAINNSNWGKLTKVLGMIGVLVESNMKQTVKKLK